MTDRVRVQLELEPMGGKRWEAIDPLARLRRVVKALGRLYGWKVTGIRSVVPLSLAQGSSAPADASGPEPQQTVKQPQERST